MPPRTDFLNQQAPENYVAGLGRGATGFTTRSDLGPAREGPSNDQIEEALKHRAVAAGLAEKKDDEDDDRFQDPENEVGLFAHGAYDRDDDEADRIYQDVDEKMDRRRKQRREAREKEERDEHERNNPKIQQQFADLKRALGTISNDEWANLPEVGDLTGRNKQRKQNLRQRFYAVPDSVIAGARDAGQYDTSVTEDGTETNGTTNGQTPDGAMTNFADISKARDKVLQVRLDQAAQGTTTSTAGTSTSVDPKGYLTSLTKSGGDMSQFQAGDINRVRGLLESVIKTNPHHPPAWIAAARLEVHAGKQVAARKLIAQGCELNKKSEDCWEECINLNEKHNARIIAAQALKNLDTSIRLWLAAANLEDDTKAKKRVLRTAIDHNPQSVTLFKQLVNLEDDPNDAKLLLHVATMKIPLSVELWLALARLETPQEAQKVLNAARKACPTSYEIWIAAARLQEQMGQPEMVDRVMKRAVQSLAKESAMLKREEWIKEAERCEQEGATMTSSAIVRETLGYSLEEDDDRKDIWLEDAKASIGSGCYATARSMLAYALRVFPTSRTVWLVAVDLERNHGETKEALWQAFDKAVEACPHSEELFLRYAREKWANGQADDARHVLHKAFQNNPESENIWLQAVQLEFDDGVIARARSLYEVARRQAGTDRIYIKSVAFERTQTETQAALDLVSDGIARYPKAAKLYMLKGQIYEHDLVPPQLPQAREAYATGMRQCPSSTTLWILAARLEQQAGLVVKARSILDRARLSVPKDAQLYLESVEVERRAGNMVAARNMMSRALQEVPPASSAALWSERLWHLDERNQRQALLREAFRKIDNDPVLFVTAARYFWSERRLEKAASWFEKAVILDPNIGDTWAWYLKFLRQHGTKEKQQDIISKCIANEPKHGALWQPVAKSPKNASKKTEEILEMVVSSLE
ncbi:MAG: hypothetical protein M1828_003236 [Chrysothrix sp. TS-e1954]|nr:MAG: hypothetical protein M1828_003236 [Chrysothrix sp. TS-e1954]